MRDAKPDAGRGIVPRDGRARGGAAALDPGDPADRAEATTGARTLESAKLGVAPFVMANTATNGAASPARRPHSISLPAGLARKSRPSFRKKSAKTAGPNGKSMRARPGGEITSPFKRRMGIASQAVKMDNAIVEIGQERDIQL